MRTAIALAVLFCLSSAAGAGSTYRWVDKDGNVHYGDQVPMGSQAKLVKPDVVLTGAGPSEAEVAAAKARAEKCENLTKQLDNYQKAGKITETDALGNVREYSDADKKKLIEQAKAKADEACSATGVAQSP